MAVKRSSKGGGPDSELARHVRRSGPVIFVTVALAAVLTLPRPVALTDLPVPAVNWPNVREHEAFEAELANQTQAVRLGYEVRAVGELVRRVGLAEAARRPGPSGEELDRAVRQALRLHGAPSLLQLRALQTQLFVQAVRDWRAPDPAPQELRELGGSFASRAAQAGWVDEHGRCLATHFELAAMYRIRWGRLTGLATASGFQPSADDWRLYYGFRLRHPEGSTPRERRKLQLAYVEGLSEYDLTFPKDFAKGVIHYGLGAYPAALQHFNRHLLEHPAGRWTLRARNGAAGAASAMLESE